MANPSFRASTTASNASGLSKAILSPSSTAIGDVLTVVYTGYSTGTYSPTPTLPSGWALLKQDVQTGAGFTIHSYTARFVATAAGAQSFTFGTSMPGTTTFGCDLALVDCYDQDPTTPIDDSQDAVVPNGTTATSPAATATVANDLILCFYVDNGNTGATPSLPSGLASAVAYQDSTNGTGIRVGYTSLISSGTTPTYTSTYGESVDPASGVFGTMFTVLVKGATTSNTAIGSATLTPTASGSVTSQGVFAIGSATLIPTAKGTANQVAVNSATGAASVFPTAKGAAIQQDGWVIEDVQHNYQKWHTAGWINATNSVICAQGDSIIIAIQCWNNNSNGNYPATMTPVGLTTIYDPSATWTGTSEPVYCQLFAATDLNAGTYTVTPPDLQAQLGDGDMYVIRVSGLVGIRSGSLGTDRQTGTNLVSTTSTLGSSAQANDLVIGIGGTDNNTSVTTLLVNSPSGWGNLGKQSDGTNSPPSSCDFTKAIGGSQSATWTWNDEASPVADSAVVSFIPGVSAKGSASTQPTAKGSATSSNKASGSSALAFIAAGAASALLSVTGSSSLEPTASGVAQSINRVRGEASLIPAAKGSAIQSGTNPATGFARLTPTVRGSVFASQALRGSTNLIPTAQGIAQAYAKALGSAAVAFEAKGYASAFLPASGAATASFSAHGTLYGSQSAKGSASLQPAASGAVHPPFVGYPADPNFYILQAPRVFYAAMSARSFYASIPSRSFYVLDDTTMPAQTFPGVMDPAEIKVLTIDGTAELPSGVTLVSIVGSPIITVTQGSDPNAGNVFSGAVINTAPIAAEPPDIPVAIGANLGVQILATNPASGAAYEIRIPCQTSRGATDVVTLKAVLTCSSS